VTEHWRGTEWRGYEVSDEHRVRSRNRVVRGKNGSSRFIAGRLLTPVLRHGHACVDLWRGNHRSRVRVDTLVQQAFGGTPALSFAKALRR
jgi:hypothetical protein